MGYSFMVDSKFLFGFVALTDQVLEYTSDTAIHNRGTKAWAQEGDGLIKSWEDFEKFEWEKYKVLLLEYEKHLDFLKANLPYGMKVVIHADDLGFKTSSMVSVEKLKELFLPWYKKFADIIHKNKKHIWMHSCGYKYNIMDYLIEDIELDAIHGFEDSNSHVQEMKQKYGKKIALLGGIDLDKLVRLGEGELRHYIRNVLKVCMDRGRFALGSGNSFCNYVPVENYFMLLEEGFRWSEQ
jgi:uroporphyrinogen decarboxylase